MGSADLGHTERESSLYFLDCSNHIPYVVHSSLQPIRAPWDPRLTVKGKLRLYSNFSALPSLELTQWLRSWWCLRDPGGLSYPGFGAVSHSPVQNLLHLLQRDGNTQSSETLLDL